jgi:hypothetical protein
VTASVLRNLSWRADGASKQTLREVGAVSGLMQAAMEGRKESTLKSILSALWNLSAHCSINKVRITPLSHYRNRRVTGVYNPILYLYVARLFIFKVLTSYVNLSIGLVLAEW